MIYREKNEKENAQEEAAVVEKVKPAQFNGYLNPYSTMLVESKNIIFRGAPGTGKTYLAKEIAADIISNGYFDDYTMLTDEQKQQVEFVQFHPSYDYSDFVEGLRPKTNEDGSMGFELQDGVFKKFVDKARKNYENSKKSTEVIANELSVQEAMKSSLMMWTQEITHSRPKRVQNLRSQMSMMSTFTFQYHKMHPSTVSD